MEKRMLGNTGIEVSELCFGVLPAGPLQKNLPPEESAEMIAYAIKSGINFLDTAQMYKTYSHIKLALDKVSTRPVIASKSTALTYEEMEEAILESLEAMGLEDIDIFHLHAAKAEADVFEVRKGALQCLLDYKAKGIIKAIGISTHNVKVVEAAAVRREIDVVFPIINKAGRGIIGGSVEEMRKAIALCTQNGKGIYLMKVLGGGTLIDEYSSSVDFSRSIEGVASISIGMVSKEEVLYNVKYFNGERDLEGIISIKSKKNPRIPQHMCASCGKCIEACHSDAIYFNESEKACIDLSKCVQCGYCAVACPHFCIRIV
ncbi:aldo/keto reductase [Clostridium formicaceticum]|uniref:2,5-diketo-D-gluconate reductase A n=1 Tax=Clostridium formicaceticum TaxID=1497 RepID=A0AAC9RPL4_9CLOT|nr:aldo/keto reductase [Clostridium formicaceticum]AOY78052.1 aldo/keto reductase [Clostridium formicaceticum]ARE88688.1 2,5-diketo-D-gluconate reductase A [Clostridium formicaceticum]